MSKFFKGKLYLTLLVLLSFSLLFTACDHVGLGGMVDTDKITIGTGGGDGSDSTPGSFLQSHKCGIDCNSSSCGLDGHNRILLDIQQDFGVKEVFLNVSYYVWVGTGENKKKQRIVPLTLSSFDDIPITETGNDKYKKIKINDIEYLLKYEKHKIEKDGEEKIIECWIQYVIIDGETYQTTFPASSDSSNEWYADLPTSEWADGRVEVYVSATDNKNDKVDSPLLIYNIKNSAPQIELSIPKIKGTGFDSVTLNNDLAENKIYVGTDLMGTAFDEKGMGVGYPKIMIWPAKDNIHFTGNKVVQTHPLTGLPVEIDSATGLPSEKDEDFIDPRWGKWHTVVDANYHRLNMDPQDTVTAMQFRWPLIDLSDDDFFYRDDGSLPANNYFNYLKPGAYNVMIITRDSFSIPNYNYYPNRVENSNFKPADNPIKFMTIKITAATNPQVRIRETPAYHNPSREYVGTISIEMPAVGTSPHAIRTRFSNEDNTDLIRSDTNIDLAVNYIDNPNADITYESLDTGNYYKIRIKSSKVIADLEGGNQSGTKYWLIKVEGSDDQTGVTRQPVVFDSQPPYINFIQPQGLSESNSPTVTSTVSIRGSTLDNQIVHSMYYVLGETETKYIKDHGLDNNDNNFLNWINTGLGDMDCLPACAHDCKNHLPINNHPGIGISGVTVPTVRTTWMPDPNVIGILPAWTWQFDDIFDFCVGAYDSTGSYPINANSPVGTQANYYVSLNSYSAQLWNLPIWFKIIDMAGNVSVIKTTLILDPNADMPKAVINTPADKSIVGGQVRVSGIAEDNEWIHSVEIRVSRRTENGALAEPNPNSWYIGGPDTWESLENHEHGNIGAEGAMRSWFITLNAESGEPLTPKTTGQLQTVLVEVRSRDAYLSTTGTIKPVAGRIESITLRFSPDVPRIGDPLIIKGTWAEYLATSSNQSLRDLLEEDYAYGDNKVSKNIVLKVPLETSADLESIRVNIGGWSEYIDRNTSVAPYNNPWVQRTSPAGQLSDNKYMLYIPVNTDTVNGDTFAWSGGTPNIFQIGVDCTDNSTNKFKANSVITLQVDNFYPLGVYDGYLTAKGEFEITGRAWDTAVGRTRVGAVERVVVFFSKDDGANNGIGTPVYLGGDNKGQTAGTAQFPLSPFNVRRNRFGSVPTESQQSVIGGEGTAPEALIIFPGGLMTNVTVGGKNTIKWVSNNNGIVIDNDTQDIASTQTGFKGGATKTWSVMYDSTQLPDGKYILHYVIFDHAMNATHYFEHIYVANNRPEIKNISLGTDNDSNGSVGNDELMLYPALTSTDPIGYKENQPYFRVMNNRFRLDINAEKGNGQKQFRVYYATRSTVSGLQAGKVYTVNAPGTFEWFNYGAPESHPNAAGYAGVTFMATKTVSLTGGATAYQYTDGVTGNTLVIGSFTGNTVTNLVNFTANFPSDSPNVHINDTTGRIDWDKDGTAARYYLVHVYDTTVGTYADSEAHRANQLSHVALINIGITNNDTMAPKLAVALMGQHYDLAEETVLNPFPTFRNYNDRVVKNLPETVAGYNQNVVTDTAGKRLGYVQYQKHAADETRADVSGMVIFKGKAMDNNRVNRITATIPGYTPPGSSTAGAAFDIATWRNNQLSVGSTANSTTGYTMAAMKDGTNPWGFEVTDTSSTGEYGNVLNWNFAWDSSLHSSLVASNVTITFTVYDGNNNATYSATATSNFSIVPYISEVKTFLSSAFRANPSAFNRSATGWYPVRESEVIEIKGFNFHNGDRTTVHLGGTDDNNGLTLVAGGGTGANDPPARSKTNINADIGTALASGALRVRVSNGATTPVWFEAINNSNNTTAHYNQEPNGLNNNNLTDDRNLYVWRVGAFYTGGVTGVIATPASSTGRDFPYLNPVLRMDARSNWYMSFGGAATNNGKIYGVKNGTAASVANNSNRWRHTTVAYDVRGNMYAIGADQTYNSTAWTFGYRVGMGDTSGAGGAWATNSSTSTNPVLAAAGGDRFQLPRIAVQSTRTNDTPNATNPTRILLSYFDTMADQTTPNQLRVHFGAVTGTSTIALNASQVVANNSQTHQGSMFTTVGFLSTGRPVVAWYDRTNQNLILSYGNDAPASNATTLNTTTAQWQSNAKIVHSFAGSHVDMVIDGNDYVHLAYYDSLNGGLYYALIPPTGTGNNIVPNVVKDTQYVKVDTYLSAGTRIMLNVRQEGTRYVPYISYFHASFDETRFSVRVAWQKDATLKAGSDENDRLTGAWEVMTVPAENVPASGLYICNGVPTSGTIIGTYRVNTSSTTDTTSKFHEANITKSMFVGYMTDINYEGAYLKHVLY